MKSSQQACPEHLLGPGTPQILLGCLLLFSFVPPHPAQAGEPGQGPTILRGAIQSETVTPRVFEGDLRYLPQPKTWQPGDEVLEIPRQVYPAAKPLLSEGAGAKRPKPSLDPLLDLQEPAAEGSADKVFTTPALNFDGIDFTGARPPDPVGDVGPNHYIQMTNGPGGSTVHIYDKTGTLVAGPFALSTLAPGGACTMGRGDPIVLYDRQADRWLLSEFADPAGGNHLCVYVSQTPDPVSGGFFLYDFTTPNFPDYPKYAVWPDAYYVSTNEATGPAVYAADRAQMLAGQAATALRFSVPTPLAGFGFQALIPSDQDGATPAPAGSPNFFVRHRDDEAHGPFPSDPVQDFLEVWEFSADFATPANSTFTGPTNIAVTEFDSDLCGLVSFECFPQPGTAVTLDPLREVVMWRLQYRNFTSHEALVSNLVTDVDGTDHGGIRWFELRRTGGGAWTLFQEGTFAPDAAHRWMGSIAMDQNGNIALGYSVSSTAVFPSVRYAGRLSTDPLGQLPQGEQTLVAGGDSQSTPPGETRWGDYSSMNVDPVDDCTFWYTNEYIPPSTGGNWRTRIGTFKFDSCGEADLALTKTDSDDPVIVGSNLTYTLTITNNGPDVATGVQLSDTLPGNVTFVSATATQGPCSQAGGTVTCDVGTLANGANATVTIVVTPTATGVLSNTATVSGIQTDPAGGNNTATAPTTTVPDVRATYRGTQARGTPSPSRAALALILLSLTRRS